MSRQWAQKKSGSNSSMSVQKSSSSQQPFTAPIYDAPAPQQTPSVQTKRRNVDWSRVTVEAQSPAGVQAKLSVGAPGDKYEQEADAIASKVMTMPDSAVQREMAPEEEKEEEVQPKLASDELQREAMPEEEELQAKPLGNGTLQREAMSEEEEVQTKPLTGTLQREVMPQEEKPVQAKPSKSSIYDDGSSDPQRQSIVSNAVMEFPGAAVHALKPGEPDETGKRTRQGWEQLIKYFHTAAPGLWPDNIIKYNPKYGYNGLPHWCGIFALWALKESGMNVGTWKQGSGISSVKGMKGTQTPKIGDVGFISEPYQHHFIVIGVSNDGKTIFSVDGNSGTDSEVTLGKRSRNDVIFYTAFPV